MQLPKKRVRLVRGTRLLNPFTGTYYRYGGRFVHADRWTVDGKIVIWMTTGTGKREAEVWARTYYIIEPEMIGLQRPNIDTRQLELFKS